MRNKIQKYLSGDHEGFSLVELIIVIAIMAILIGVVALAVLPYLEKSRESKDISMLDTINSALAASVASTQVSGSGSFVWGTTPTQADAQKVSADMLDTVGGNSSSFNSAALKGASIMCKYDATANKMYTFAGDGSNYAQAYCFKRTTTNATVPSGVSAAANATNGTTADATKIALTSN